MNKILILLFSLLLSFNSYGDWTKIIKKDGKTFFIYFDNFKKKDDSIYWWLMSSGSEDSMQSYILSDCDMNRIKPIQAFNYTEPLGKGKSSVDNLDDESWIFLAPETVPNALNSIACQYAALSSDDQEAYVKDLIIELRKLMIDY